MPDAPAPQFKIHDRVSIRHGEMLRLFSAAAEIAAKNIGKFVEFPEALSQSSTSSLRRYARAFNSAATSDIRLSIIQSRIKDDKLQRSTVYLRAKKVGVKVSVAEPNVLVDDIVEEAF